MELPDGVSELEDIWDAFQGGYRDEVSEDDQAFIEQMQRRYEAADTEYEVSFSPAEVGRLMSIYDKIIGSDLDFEDFDDDEIDFYSEEDGETQ